MATSAKSHLFERHEWRNLYRKVRVYKYVSVHVCTVSVNKLYKFLVKWTQK